MKGMPSHFIPPLLDYQYPSGEPNYFNLDRTIFEQYYNNYIARLHLNCIDNTAIDWYRTQYNQDFPASFALDNKGAIALSPGNNRRWLVFVHSGAAVYLHLARYIVVSGERVRLFGDGSAGLTLDTGAGGVTLSGVDVPLDHTIGSVIGDVSSL